ncbi:MAG: hypothetical protein NC089_13200 [Bacteroides sp.]|nr:hypothetical protein [Bacteroides sp.]MCM1550088.1 hypothetical protein [Clostridium sp.]
MKITKLGRGSCRRLFSILLSGLLVAGFFPETVSTVYAESPYDDPGKFCICLTEANAETGSEDWLGIDTSSITDPDSVSGEDYDGDFLNVPYWKNDPAHAGKLIPGTEEDYNLKYAEDTGALYLKGLNLVVNGSEGANVIYTNLDLNIIMEADSEIVCNGEVAIVGEKTVTFSGDGNLTITTTVPDDADEDKKDRAALIAGGNVTNNLNGTITLNSAGDAEGLWWLNDPCEILGTGAWDGTPLVREDDGDGEWVTRQNYTDNERHMGYSGCYITEDEYQAGEIFWDGTPEWAEAMGPLFWVHGSTIQEVIDKLSGTVPVTFYDADGRVSNLTVPDVKRDCIRICVSTSNYAADHAEEQYITSTRDFEKIYIQGGYDKQMTNHDREEDGYYVEDTVRDITGVRDVLMELGDNYGLPLQMDISDVQYVSVYRGDFYVATRRDTTDAEHPYSFDIDFDKYITNEGEIIDAIWKEDGYYSDHDEPAEGEPDLVAQILGEDTEIHVMLPFKTLHINSDCDFKIAGMWENEIEAPSNPEGINIYFGFLPDTNHSISFIVDNEDGDGWHDETYRKEDLRNPLRDVITFSPGASINQTNIKVLMYQHVTSGTVTGNYGEPVTMENIPDAKLLRDAELTDEQLDILENKGSVDIDLSVNQINVQTAGAQTAIADIQKELSENNYVCEAPVYLDLSMSASIRNSQNEALSFQDGDSSIALTELNQPVALTVTIPERIRTTGREYEIVRRHIGSDGSVQTEMIPVEYNAAANSLTFETDRFSTYAIVYKDVAGTGSTSADASTQASGSTPSTGDSAPIGMMVLLFCLAGGGFAVMKRKKSM